MLAHRTNLGNFSKELGNIFDDIVCSDNLALEAKVRLKKLY